MTAGELLVIGGNEEKFKDEAGILKTFAELSRKKGGIIGILPTASKIPEEVSSDYVEVFQKLGINETRVLNVKTSEDAESADMLETVSNLSTLFITGGDQNRLTKVIKGTKLHNLFYKKWAGGMVIGGTSAGASIMGKHMITSAETKENNEKLQIEMGEGFGFLETLIIDQHFSQRARFGRLLGAIAENPDLIGIGIDENTAILVDGGRFEVLGEHQVFVIDGKDGQFVDATISGNGGEELTISNFKLHTLTKGYRFDLFSRTLIGRKEEFKG